MIGELDSGMGTCECDGEKAKVSRSARDSALVSKERLLMMKEGEAEKDKQHRPSYFEALYGSCC